MSSRETVSELLEALGTDHSTDDIEELPDVLEGLNPTEKISVARLDSSLNLNAVTIGLGLEDIVYEPERFLVWYMILRRARDQYSSFVRERLLLQRISLVIL